MNGAKAVLGQQDERPEDQQRQEYRQQPPLLVVSQEVPEFAQQTWLCAFREPCEFTGLVRRRSMSVLSFFVAMIVTQNCRK